LEKPSIKFVNERKRSETFNEHVVFSKFKFVLLTVIRFSTIITEIQINNRNVNGTTATEEINTMKRIAFKTYTAEVTCSWRKLHNAKNCVFFTKNY
jgi:hypothetical protein